MAENISSHDQISETISSMEIPLPVDKLALELVSHGSSSGHSIKLVLHYSFFDIFLLLLLAKWEVFQMATCVQFPYISSLKHYFALVFW